MTRPAPDPADPYRAPLSPIGPVVASTAAPADVALRRRFVRHERAVLTLGLLMYALAAWLAVASLGAAGPGLAPPRAPGPGPPPRTIRSVIGHLGIDGAVMGLVARVGFGLRRLRGWARWLVLIPTALALVATLGFLLLEGCHFVALFIRSWSILEKDRLLADLLGGLVPALVLAYFTFLLGSDQGHVVFSDPYRAAVAATPELNPRAGPIVRLGFGLVMALAALGLLAVLSDLAFG